jgi:ubiquinone/menaquinone biosynthesis C-methylase UbiE
MSTPRLFLDVGQSDRAGRKLKVKPLTIAAESERIRRVFGERKESGGGQFEPFRLQTHQERQERLLAFFRESGLESLQDLKLLDIGCGSGGQLRRMTDFGAEPANCFGIDLFRKSLGDARRVNPNISFAEANAAQLPFAGGAFDIVFQFTVVTSVLENHIRREIAAEIHRVLRPGGYFIWYDFAYSNPRNPNVRGVGHKEIKELLDGFRLQFSKITLAPPIGRPAARISPILYRMLAAIPLLRTHYFCFAQKT